MSIFWRPIHVVVIDDDVGSVFHELCFQFTGGVTGNVAVTPEQIGDIAVQKMECSTIGGRGKSNIIVGFTGIFSHCHSISQQEIFARIFHPIKYQSTAVIGIEKMNWIAELLFVAVTETVPLDSIYLIAG